MSDAETGIGFKKNSGVSWDDEKFTVLFLSRSEKAHMDEKKIAMNTSIISMIVNVILSVFKLFAGVFARSSAMISDAVHSTSDIFSTIVVMLGVHAASRAADKQHPYGHERMECVAAGFLAAVLAATGLGIGYMGVQRIIQGIEGNLETPGVIALVAAVVSIITKEWMYRFTKRRANKINSSALMADAWHHRSDAFSSIGSLVGIGGALLGLPILDPIASLVICVLILKAAFDVAKDAMAKMVDTACDGETEENIRKVILQQQGVCGIDELKTRTFASKIYVDTEIAVDGTLLLKEAHKIAEEVHLALEKSNENIKHCMVHVNPCQKEESTPGK